MADLPDPADLLEYLEQEARRPRQMLITGGHVPFPDHEPNPVPPPTPVPIRKRRRRPRRAPQAD